MKLFVPVKDDETLYGTLPEVVHELIEGLKCRHNLLNSIRLIHEESYGGFSIDIEEERYFVEMDEQHEVLHLTRMLTECDGCPYYEGEDDDGFTCAGSYPESFPDGLCNTVHVRKNYLSDTYDFTNVDEIKDEQDFSGAVRGALLLLYNTMLKKDEIYE